MEMNVTCHSGNCALLALRFLFHSVPGRRHCPHFTAVGYAGVVLYKQDWFRVNVVGVSLTHAPTAEVSSHTSTAVEFCISSPDKEIWWLGPGESKEEMGKMKKSSLKVELHSDPVFFSVDCLWFLLCAYQQLAARGAKGCSGNSALFTRLGTACLTTSRCCFNFLPFGGQFEEHLSISPFLLLASWIHERWELIVLTHCFCHQKCEAVSAFS